MGHFYSILEIVANVFSLYFYDSVTTAAKKEVCIPGMKEYHMVSIRIKQC